MNQHVEAWRAPATMSQFASTSDLVMHVQRTGDNLAAEVERLEAELAAYKHPDTQPRPVPPSVVEWRENLVDKTATQDGLVDFIQGLRNRGDALVKDLESLYVDYVRAIEAHFCYPKVGEPYRWKDRVTELEKELANYKKYEFQPRPVLESVLNWRKQLAKPAPLSIQKGLTQYLQAEAEAGNALVNDIELLTNENMRLHDELKGPAVLTDPTAECLLLMNLDDSIRDGCGHGFPTVVEFLTRLRAYIQELKSQLRIAREKKKEASDALVIAPQLQNLIERLRTYCDFDSNDGTARKVAIDCNDACDKLLKLFDIAYGTRPDGHPFLWKDIVEKVEKTLKGKLAKAHRAREAAEHARGVANLQIRILTRKNAGCQVRIKELKAELATAKKDGECDVCKGTGKPFHDKSPCVCGGTGKMSKELEHFRRLLMFGNKKAVFPVADLYALIERLKAVNFSDPAEELLQSLALDITSAIEWLSRLHGSNETLRRRLDGIHAMYQGQRFMTVKPQLDKDADKIFVCRERDRCGRVKCIYHEEHLGRHPVEPPCQRQDLEQVGGPDQKDSSKPVDVYAEAEANAEAFFRCRQRDNCPYLSACVYRCNNRGIKGRPKGQFAVLCADLEMVKAEGPLKDVKSPKDLAEQAVKPWIESTVPLFICANRKRKDWCAAVTCKFWKPCEKGNSWPKCAKLEQVGGPVNPPTPDTKEDLTAIKITCGNCGYVGAGNTYYPNLTSIQNACRCPKCHSTNNDYNVRFQEKLRAAQEKIAGTFMTCPYCKHAASATSFESRSLHTRVIYACPNCDAIFVVQNSQIPGKDFNPVDEMATKVMETILREKDSLVAQAIASGLAPMDIQIVEGMERADGKAPKWVIEIRRKKDPYKEYEEVKYVTWGGYGDFRKCSGCGGDIHHDYQRCPHCGGHKKK